MLVSAVFAVLLILEVNANEWSACSKSCGGGSQNIQSCIWGTCSTIYRGCNLHSCVSAWGTWQPCSKSCGGGTRFKVESCSLNDIKKCPKTYEDCNTQACTPLAKCPAGHTFRYGDLSSCCKETGNEICGVLDPLLHKRVFGGKQAKLGQWPWAAVMVKKSTDTTHCGANLIHKQWVLTAAHCLVGYQEKDYYVLLGSISIKFPAKTSQKIEIEKFEPHKNYSDPLNDIGLVKLKTDATINSAVKPACLPSGETVQQDTKCIAAGWGTTTLANTQAGTASDVLMQVALRVLPLDSCVQGLKKIGSINWPHITPSQHLCFGILSGGRDTCTGDSGGPMVCQRCKSCNWYLAAITSFGPADCGTPGIPGVYVNVKLYEKWIRQHVSLANTNFFTCK